VSFAGLGEVGGTLLQRLWPLSVIISLVPVMALAAIFLYKKRTLQMRVTMLILLLSIGTIILGAFYVFMFDRKIEISLIWKVKALFPLISAILAGLAYRRILVDDMLVKSYDRLR
jgi:peptidoglycan/LPS O-acetylase OafA/YrhL